MVMREIVFNLLVAITAQLVIATALYAFKFARRKADEFARLHFTVKDRFMFLACFIVACATSGSYFSLAIQGRWGFSFVFIVVWSYSFTKTLELFYKYYYAALKFFESERSEQPAPREQDDEGREP